MGRSAPVLGRLLTRLHLGRRTLAIKVTLFWIIAWLTKGNVLHKNLKKLEPPDELGFAAKAIAFTGAFLLEVALSWINVLVSLWQIASTLMKTLREVLASTPEAIKVLRFPLRNNPNMSRESVWAHVHALRIEAGDEVPGKDELLYSLNRLCDEHPSFDRDTALNHLLALNVMDPTVISWAARDVALADEET